MLRECYVGKVKDFRKYLARRRKWFLLWKLVEEADKLNVKY